MTPNEQARIFQQWIRDHQGLLFKIVRAYAFNFHDQEDLFQEIAIQIWNSIPKFKQDSAVTTWLYRVGLYSAIAWSKRENRHRESVAAIGKAALSQPDTPSRPDPRLDWLYDQIAKLDEVDRSVALMWLDGASYQVIADATGMSPSNVGVKINRMKKYFAELQPKVLG
ncbi:MAG: sigma-70 family RNA polymerase sigma factor [Planctomycetota bacterium]